MKFGKEILAQQIPGWSQYYLDYKALKKIVSSLASTRPSDEAATLAPDTLPANVTNLLLPLAPSSLASTQPTDISPPQIEETLHLLPVSASDEDRGPRFQAHKTAFFFKLERELEKINSFYLQKEAELKLRLETLLSKRRAAAARVLPDESDTTPKDHVEWRAVEEGFRLLERDLAKLQQFVDINATGFRKILKKWDKRSKSTTKELYLSRQVEVQPVFNRQLIAELSDIVASCLMDLTDLSVGLTIEGSTVNDLMLAHQIALERIARTAPFNDLETNLLTAIRRNDEVAVREIVRQSDILSEQGGKAHVTRILWKGIIEAPTGLADIIVSSTAAPFDFSFVDDINGRTCLHEAASTGQLRLVDLCLQKGVEIQKADIYGRNALHYAAMNGHAPVCRRLISIGVQSNSPDLDNLTPLVYAVIRSHVECVKVLLDDGHVNIEPATVAIDLIPLSLACQVGSVDIVLILLQHGAKSVPNTNGEYPIHLAAKEGHAEICPFLRHHDGWDLADKYNEWTPLFHAARYGHEACVKVLLELGSRVWAVDENGKRAIFYASWYGHLGCARLLLEHASVHLPPIVVDSRSPQVSPYVETEVPNDLDIDTIPSLYLPPPIMPYRVYGHNYLDNVSLVQVSVGHPFSKNSSRAPAVQLVPRIAGPATSLFPHTSPLFKLVMTSKPDIPAAPYSVSIPIRDEKDVLTFQTSNHDALTLEFSVYPNFGTKTIGRAVVLPSLLRNLENGQAIVLPILDHHLHVIGEVSFEVSIIKPFMGVTLQIGGAVETYWKSQAMPFIPPPPKSVLHGRHASHTGGSAYTSPSNHSLSGLNSHTLTFSSLSGDYIHLVVQVTRDLQPVIFDRWKLPVEEYDLGIAELTLVQVKHLAAKLGKNVQFAQCHSLKPFEWHKVLSGSLVSLEELMRELPSSMGVYLELAHPSTTIQSQYNLSRRHDPNDFVDAILRVVYQSSLRHSRRSIVFGSFSPTICATVNWKQPNYPVFYASQCGIQNRTPPSHTALGPAEIDDRRLSSIHTAVEWAKTNNLLGILVAADLLGKVPELIQGVKDNGLLIGAYGTQQEQTMASGYSNYNGVVSVEVVTAGVDAVLQDGVVSFLEHASRGLI